MAAAGFVISLVVGLVVMGYANFLATQVTDSISHQLGVPTLDEADSGSGTTAGSSDLSVALDPEITKAKISQALDLVGNLPAGVLTAGAFSILPQFAEQYQWILVLVTFVFTAACFALSRSSIALLYDKRLSYRRVSLLTGVIIISNVAGLGLVVTGKFG